MRGEMLKIIDSEKDMLWYVGGKLIRPWRDPDLQARPSPTNEDRMVDVVTVH